MNVHDNRRPIMRFSLHEFMILFLVALSLTCIFEQYLVMNYLDREYQTSHDAYPIFNHNGTKGILSASTITGNVSPQLSLNPRAQDNAFLTMYGAHRVPDSTRRLPKWLQNYVTWHRNQTLHASNDTQYVILTCMPKDAFCGGLSDRLRPLPVFLLFASMVPRVLCIHYLEPQQLENFLQPPPNGLDWRCPSEISTLFDESKESSKQDVISAYNIDRCNSENKIVSCMETKIKYMRNDKRKYLVIKLVSNDVLSIQNALSLVQRHSYVSNMPTIDNWNFVDFFGDLFRVMFEPIQPLAIRINQTMRRLGLAENQYSSVHTRCRYPVYPVARHQGKAVDKGGGMQFVNKTKEALIEIMQNAVKCAYLLEPNISTIYFASDHDDATRYMISHDVPLGNGKFVQPVGIDRDNEPLHMGNLEDSHLHKAHEYFSIFEDLLIMGGSKCVSHGVGSFGSFGAALAGNKCRAIHRKFTGGAVACPNDRARRHIVPITGDVLFGKMTGDMATEEI